MQIRGRFDGLERNLRNSFGILGHLAQVLGQLELLLPCDLVVLALDIDPDGLEFGGEPTNRHAEVAGELF